MGGGNRGSEGGTLAELTGHDYGGGSSVALRGFPTLVLINERRAAVSPIAAYGGGNEFVDLNIIPLFAIRSVEILRDGGSAAYGTDAIGGVVHLTTSRVAKGGSIGGFYQTAPQNGGWENRGVNFSFGHVGRRTQFLIAGGWARSDPLWADQRGFSNPLFGTDRRGGKIRIGEHHFALNPALAKPPVSVTKPAIAFPMTNVPTAPDGRLYFGVSGSNAVYWGKQDGAGAIIGFSGTDLTQGTPAAAQVAYNRANSTMLQQQRETHAAIVTLEHRFNERWSAFSDVLFAHVKTFSQFASQGFGRIVSAANPNNPFDVEIDVTARILPAPRQSYWDTVFGRLVAGLRDCAAAILAIAGGTTSVSSTIVRKHDPLWTGRSRSLRVCVSLRQTCWSPPIDSQTSGAYRRWSARLNAPRKPPALFLPVLRSGDWPEGCKHQAAALRSGRIRRVLPAPLPPGVRAAE
jgi:outer membrane receptor protein involved in Fe transport